MCDSTLTRRQLLRYGALVAATFPAAGLLRPDFALAQVVGPGLAVPMNCELVTVTDTEMAVTWFTGDPTQLDEFGRPRPVAAPGRLLLGTSPDPTTWVEVASHGPTAYHHVELEGLLPGTTYYWQAQSNGIPATTAASGGGSPTEIPAASPFTTLVLPPGREIGRVAWLNDLHYGEQVAGLIQSIDGFPGGGIPPGFPVDPANPYWRFMGAGAVAMARRRGCTLLLANGDLSNESEVPNLQECRQQLDAFGTLGGTTHVGPGDAPTYFVTRGNHDRARTSGPGPDSPPYHGDAALGDAFSGAFDGGFVPGTNHFSVTIGDDLARYRFVGLDSNDGSDTGVLRPSELEFLEAELQRGDATIPLFHHPANGSGDLEAADATAFRQLVGRHGNTAAVYAGHTHKNARVEATETGPLPYFEGGAVKEYPGGSTVVRLFEGGYMVNFWRTDTPDALAWTERSRGEYLGAAPLQQLGTLGDRNWTFNTDARVGGPTPVVPDLPSPALALAGAALGVAAVASVRARRQEV